MAIPIHIRFCDHVHVRIHAVVRIHVHVCVPCSLGMGILFFLFLNCFILPYYSLPLFLLIPHYSFPLSQAICSRLSLGCVSTLIIVGSSASNSLLGFEINDGIPCHLYSLITDSSIPGKALQTGCIKKKNHLQFFFMPAPNILKEILE